MVGVTDETGRIGAKELNLKFAAIGANFCSAQRADRKSGSLLLLCHLSYK